MSRMRVVLPPLRVTLLPPSRTRSLVIFCGALRVIVTGSGPQSKVTMPPAAIAAERAASLAARGAAVADDVVGGAAVDELHRRVAGAGGRRWGVTGVGVVSEGSPVGLPVGSLVGSSRRGRRWLGWWGRWWPVVALVLELSPVSVGPSLLVSEEPLSPQAVSARPRQKHRVYKVIAHLRGQHTWMPGAEAGEGGRAQASSEEARGRLRPPPGCAAL
jgi:hypothetical protein